MKVLVAEDESIQRFRLQSILEKWGYEVSLASDGNEAWNILQSTDSPTLAILDWMMPGLDGVQICRTLRERNASPYIYVLVLTIRNQTQDLIQALEAGADDYLSKPFDPSELRARLHAGERILQLQSQLLEAQEKLRVQAARDPLTELWNHREILAILARERERCTREHTRLGVIMADLDKFKRVNDTYGHLAGDEVLVEISDRIRHSIRPYDAIGRFGGEEFLIVLPGCGLEQTHRLAERIRRQVLREPIEARGHHVRMSISLGVAAYTPHRPAEVEELIQEADQALYRAKALGGNHVAQVEGEPEDATV